MKKDFILYNSNDASSNITALVRQAGIILKQQKRSIEYLILVERVKASKSYNEAFNIINEYVELIDISKENECER